MATVTGMAPPAGRLFVGLGRDDLLAPVEARRADVVAPMHLARHRLDCERRIGERVVRAMHSTLRRRFLVLLNGHAFLLGSKTALLRCGLRFELRDLRV